MYMFTIVVVSVLYEEQIIPIKHESIFCKLSCVCKSEKVVKIKLVGTIKK